MKIDFNTLLDLAEELNDDNALYVTLDILVMNDVPMTNTVVKLAIVCGIADVNYKCGWSRS